MKQEITTISQLIVQLKKKYQTSHCTHCTILQDYFKIEYQRLVHKLKSLEKLSASNDCSLGNIIAETKKEASVLGMYVMV